MLQRLKSKIFEKLGLVLDLAAFLGTSGGAIVGGLRGKIPVALFLCVCAFAFFLRVTSQAQKISKPRTAPGWVIVSNVALSIVSVAFLVEATNLPVRFTQDGFEYWHWALVLVALVALFALFSQVYNRFSQRGKAS